MLFTCRTARLVSRTLVIPRTEPLHAHIRETQTKHHPVDKEYAWAVIGGKHTDITNTFPRTVYEI